MRKGAVQTHSNEELGEEAGQALELAKLQRQLRVMEGDRRAYAEESNNILRKKMSEKEALVAENEEIRTVLRLAQSEKNESMDIENTNRLMELIDNLDSFNNQAEQEVKRIAELDAEVARVEEEITKHRRAQGGNTEQMVERTIQKKIRVKENRLDKAMVKFNQQLAVNANLRQEIDHLRQERSVFDGLFKKLTNDLSDIKAQMDEVIAEAARAYEERDEAQNKMIALKERSEKDMAQHEVEMKDLQRIINHDNKLKQFLLFKAHDRAEFKDEEEAKKNKNARDKDTDAEREQINVYEEAFDKIKEATEKQDISVIVNNFIAREDENFALFNYVNELNEEVEGLNEEIRLTKAEMEAFEIEDIRMMECNKITLKDLQSRSVRVTAETEVAQKKIDVIRGVLDELRSGVTSLFETIHCDSSTIKSILGSEEEITDKNILHYMGIMEQRTMEMLQLQQYLHLKQNPPKPEKKDKKGQEAPPITQFIRTDIPPPISIQTPASADDDDVSDILVGQDEVDIRPLTHDELRAMAQRNITKRAISTSAKANHVRRSKSPRPP
ncbi:coiled-coil domain-containing protein 63-like [Ylistrum balloti]|uniref:coiled-coil domain-containing protein 63-like n=1 Tax=Ylistrum balloti TaxID=509963 RepID=UPI002905E8FC|nr:coiled-coil domain-containing protein 63-like [Ylistrum balloti]